jgi:diguanylate cyclase (GGDEF)-like protein
VSFISLIWRFLPLLILLAAFLVARFNPVTFIDTGILLALPYLLSFLVLVFASMFNRSRFIAPVLIALFAYYVIRERLQVPLSRDTVMALFAGLNLLFCAQLLLTALWPEKGMFNRMGVTLLALLLSGSVLFWFFADSAVWISGLSQLQAYNNALFTTHYWITEAWLITHGLTLSVLLLFSVFRRSKADYALLLTWLAGVLVFIDFSLLNVSSLCFSALLLGLFVFYQQSSYQVTYKDALTGIPGRRALEDYLSTLGRHYAIAMLDVDHFKKFNDTYGHDVGDQVLKMVASKVAQVQGGGKAFRYGGEEFTVVFNRKSAEDAFVFLEAVRQSIEHYVMTLRSDERAEDKKTGKALRGKNAKSKSGTVSVTISIGVATSEAGQKPQDVIKAADQLLYKAKEAGRNCTVKL